MAKKKIQPGDIFELKVSDSKFVCLQFICEEPEMLGGDLVRFFYKSSPTPISENDVPDFVNSGIRSYEFTYISTGLKFDLYRYITNLDNINQSDIKKLTFESFTDSHIVDGELGTRYSIRKLGEDFRSGFTTAENYNKLKNRCWTDAVMFAEGHIASILHEDIKSKETLEYVKTNITQWLPLFEKLNAHGIELQLEVNSYTTEPSITILTKPKVWFIKTREVAWEFFIEGYRSPWGFDTTNHTADFYYTVVKKIALGDFSNGKTIFRQKNYIEFTIEQKRYRFIETNVSPVFQSDILLSSDIIQSFLANKNIAFEKKEHTIEIPTVGLRIINLGDLVWGIEVKSILVNSYLHTAEIYGVEFLEIIEAICSNRLEYKKRFLSRLKDVYVQTQSLGSIYLGKESR